MIKQRLSDGSRLILFLIAIVLVFAFFAFILRPILSAIGLSVVLSYLLSKPITKLQVRFGIDRSLLAALVLLIIFLTLLIVGVFVLPSVYHQLIQLVEKIPTAVASFQTIWLPKLAEALNKTGFSGSETILDEISHFQLSVQIKSRLTTALTAVIQSAPVFISAMINLALIPPLTYVLLVHQRRIYGFLQDLIPRGLLSPIRRLLLNGDQVIQALIKGHLSVAAILAFFYTLGLTFVGLPFGFAIGFIAGICRIIPYGDLVVGVFLSAIALLTSPAAYEPRVGVGTLLVFICVQIMDGVYVTPRMIGGRLGVHPVVAIASILALGGVFGFWGVVLAIPAAAFLRQAWLGLKPIYFDSKFYRE